MYTNLMPGAINHADAPSVRAARVDSRHLDARRIVAAAVNPPGASTHGRTRRAAWPQGGLTVRDKVNDAEPW